MGLDIHATESGGHIRWPYSVLTTHIRYLVLQYCGVPEYIGTDENGEKLRSLTFLMYPRIPNNFRFDGGFPNNNLAEVLGSLMLAAKIFPEIMFHSDCDGHFTHTTICDPLNRPEDYFMHGNIDNLLKELNILCYEESFRNSNDERIIYALKFTKRFRDLVKNEIDNGFGIVLFR